MKKFLKYVGLGSVLLAVIALILILSTPVATIKVGSSTLSTSGTYAIFGHKGGSPLDPDISLAWTGLLAFIFIVLATLAEVVVVVLPLLKVNALAKVEKFVHLGVALLLLVAGIFVFCTKGALSAANSNFFDDYTIGAGFVIAGILLVLGSLTALVPVLFGCKKCCCKCCKK